MTESDPVYHPEFDALGPDSPYMTSEASWPPQSSRHDVANGTPWQGGKATPAQIIAAEVLHFVNHVGGNKTRVVAEVDNLIDGRLIGGSQKAAAVLALSAYLAARVGWHVVPPGGPTLQEREVQRGESNGV